MNIQALLKKLNNKQHNTKFIRPYKVKTSESVGTLNSVPDECSFVILESSKKNNHSSQDSADQCHKTPVQNKSAVLSKLDEELSEIQKMKYVYESRQMRNKSVVRSNERSSAKSHEKHVLKPSNTPSFNKVTKMRQGLTQEACNLHSQISAKIQKTQSEHKTHELRQESGHLNFTDQGYMMPYEHDSSNRPHYQHDPKQLKEMIPFCYQEPSNKNNMIYNSHSPINEMPKCLNNKAYDSSSILEQKNILSHNMSYRTASANVCCCSSIKQFVEGIQNKLELMNDKIKQLSDQNEQLRGVQDNLAQKYCRLENAFGILTNQGEKTSLDLRKIEGEKEELQSMLKDVLYKRQREKMLNYKENTQSGNDRKGNLDSSYGLQVRYKRPKTSDSKMKVENLLHKLQIKVDRV